MAALQWDKQFEVGLPEFDRQHQRLLELVTSALALLQKPKQTRDIYDLVEELMSYTQYHFGAEEVWMIEQGYPHYTEHKAEHQELLKGVQKFIDRIDKKEIKGITDELLGFINTWLMAHLMNSDCKLGEFYEEKQTKTNKKIPA